MVNDEPYSFPTGLASITVDAQQVGFAMSCDPRTGSLLATLAASKPGGRFIELGTGAGAGSSWLLHGMTLDSQLLSIDVSDSTQRIARRHLGSDPRVSFEVADAAAWIDAYAGPPFDMAFVDCRPGKFQRLDVFLRHLAAGALYVGDDLLPQPTWPEDHQQRVDGFLERLPGIGELIATPMAWASGLVVATKRACPES
ncbi:O-methyltransferase [Geodermatophilus sp. URMC 62]|uniref:O-methyltransferase n=1 Tax=Geodermatophilus sp. URMC 62 TaxID=3423414 RepID=UPI00406CC9D2